MCKLTAACLLLLIATAGAAEKYREPFRPSSSSRLPDISFVAAIRFGERRGLMLRRLICLFFSCLLVSGGFGKSPSPENAADRFGLVDLMGRAADPWRGDSGKWRVFIFVRTDCPVSNSYAPEVARLHAEFAPRKVAFCLVYPDADETAAMIAQHMKEYGYPCAALRDPRLIFARRSRVRVTPEAALYNAKGELLYHGRIDNRYAALGKSRPVATRHELRDALTLALEGKSVTMASPPAVGCLIEGGE